MIEFKKGKGLLIQAHFNTTNLNGTHNRSATAFDEMTFMMKWKCNGMHPKDSCIASFLCGDSALTHPSIDLNSYFD